MGHIHYRVPDVEATKKFWIALGGKRAVWNNMEVLKFPGFLVRFSKADTAEGTDGSVVSHVGMRVPNVAKAFAHMKAAGYRVEPNENGVTGDVFMPDGEKIELLEALSENVKFTLDGGRKDFEAERNNRRQESPIELHHIHFYVPTDDVAKVKDWYVRLFSAVPGHRFRYESADLPGVELDIRGVDNALAPIRGRRLDHIGFEVKNLAAFCKKLEASGVKFDRPYEMRAEGVATAFLTDPWGVYIELTEGLTNF